MVLTLARDKHETLAMSKFQSLYCFCRLWCVKTL